MPLPEVHTPLSDGWVSANETWTYSDGTTVTVPNNATTKYSIGDKIRLDQTTDGTKYYYVSAVGSTSLNIIAGSDYDLDNETISANYFSKAETPQGFPGWFNYAASYVGNSSMTYSTATNYHSKFKYEKNWVVMSFLAVGTTGGTASAGINITTPINCGTNLGNINGYGWVTNPGASGVPGGYYALSGGTSIQARKYDNSAYSLGANVYVSGVITYEVV